MPTTLRAWLLAAASAATLTGAAPALALRNEPRAEDLLRMSPAELLDMRVFDQRVSSVSRTTDTVADSPAAVFVLSREDIRRSGATSIPEALRMIPGVTVARIDANKWAIAIRGQNSRFFNKLLVLMDGRILYDPLHAGVYWDVQDTVMEDIDRIEVIRGPGATLWGSNAVTGVIQVFTRHSRETVGDAASVVAGDRERALLSLRHGEEVPGKGTYRVFGRATRRDETVRSNGLPGRDEWESTRGGFRLDYTLREQDTLTLLGNVYGGKADQITSPAAVLDAGGIPFHGSSFQVQWTHPHGPDATTSVHAYSDFTDRREINFREHRKSCYAEAQHQRRHGKHRVLIGASLYDTADDIRDLPFLQIAPEARELRTTAVFLQDTYDLVPRRLTVSGGVRFERNVYTSSEFQHSTRLLWKPSESQSVWASLSRAVRTPSRLEFDLSEIAVPPFRVVNQGSELIQAEKLDAYEGGYRIQVNPRLAIDLAAFFERSTDLLDFQVGPPTGTVFPFRFISRLEGTARGYEAFVDYAATRRWRLAFGYADLDLRFTGPDASPDVQYQLRSYYDLTKRVQLDATLYHVDRVRAGDVPSYDRVDLRLGWRPSSASDVSLVCQNLFDDRHPESGAATGPLGRAEIQRGTFVRFATGF